jgi:hypothetical protein
VPLTTPEMDYVYGLPFARAPHPSYGDAKIPAWEMIRFSINIMRGCFGGCTFCSITEHEGRIIQSRSEASILHEIEEIRDKTPGFTGVISDLGGPTANMYRLACKDAKIEEACRRLSCVYPGHLPEHGHRPRPAGAALPQGAGAARHQEVLIGSGLRYDLAVRSPEYVKELVTHHVGGYLKIAPEHTEAGPLSKMMKPGIGAYDRFKAMFEKFSREAGKEQYLIPYFIAAHPGTTDEDMLPGAVAEAQRLPPRPGADLPADAAGAGHRHVPHGEEPAAQGDAAAEGVEVVRGGRQRKLHKAFLRYHDPENWPLLREALRRMGRADLIGSRSLSKSTRSTTSPARPRPSTTSTIRCRRPRPACMARSTCWAWPSASRPRSCRPRPARSTATRKCIRRPKATGATSTHRTALLLRRRQALRRNAVLRLPPPAQAAHQGRAHLQHLRPAHAPERRPRGFELHRPGAEGRPSPSMATACRRAPSATSTTWWTGLLRLMNSPDEFPGPVNLGNPVEFTILELAQKIIAKTGSKSPIVKLPLPADDPVQRKPDITLARTVLGWNAKITLDDGLPRAIDYFRRITAC